MLTSQFRRGLRATMKMTQGQNLSVIHTNRTIEKVKLWTNGKSFQWKTIYFALFVLLYIIVYT